VGYARSTNSPVITSEYSGLNEVWSPVPSYSLKLTYPGPSRGGKEGKFSRAPRRLGRLAIAQKYWKWCCRWLFLTSNIHKIHFRPGRAPPRTNPSGGAYDRRSPRALVGWWGDTPPHVSSLSTPSASRGCDRAPRCSCAANRFRPSFGPSSVRRGRTHIVLGWSLVYFPGPRSGSRRACTYLHVHVRARTSPSVNACSRAQKEGKSSTVLIIWIRA